MDRIGLRKRIEGNLLWQAGVCILLLALIWMGYYGVMKQLNKRYVVVEDDFSWVYQIDDISVESKKMLISGWAFELNNVSTKGVYDIILYDVEKGKAYFPKMRYQSRKDVNDYFLCEHDYTDSGFVASISLGKLDLENSVYEILVRPKGSYESFSTGVFYCEGEIRYINPKEYTPLDVINTDLEKIVNEGKLRVYRPDYGMYVYQYKGELYWIADENYGFIEGDTYVQFQMDTTQPMKLPEERLEKNWFWGNLGFDFTTNEIETWNTDKYRVAKCALPTDYSITKIWTGNHLDGWIWKQDFRPWYELE